MLQSLIDWFKSLFGAKPIQSPQPQPSAPLPIETVLTGQTPTVQTYSNVSPSKGTLGVTLWGPVEKLPCPPTGVTSAGGVLDIVIDAGSIPGNMAARNGLGSIVMGYSFKTPIQAPQYRVSYDLRTTRAVGIAQVVAYLNLHDKLSNTSLWIGQIAFDSRPGKQGDVMWDQGTNTPLFTTVSPNIALPTFDWRRFSFMVGQAELANAVNQLKAKFPGLKLSSNLGDYELTHTNVNPEISGAGSRIEVGIRNWRVSRLD